LSDDVSKACFAEFSRILKPGGVLIFTTNSENTYDALSSSEKAPYDSGAPVIKARVTEGKKQYLQLGGDEYYRGLAGQLFEEIFKDIHPYESGSVFLNDKSSQTVRVYQKL
jgi:ubiquinone/menaquinone biosynthesis C-methylase UbiE